MVNPGTSHSLTVPETEAVANDTPSGENSQEVRGRSSPISLAWFTSFPTCVLQESQDSSVRHHKGSLNGSPITTTTVSPQAQCIMNDFSQAKVLSAGKSTPMLLLYNCLREVDSLNFVLLWYSTRKNSLICTDGGTGVQACAHLLFSLLPLRLLILIRILALPLGAGQPLLSLFQGEHSNLQRTLPSWIFQLRQCSVCYPSSPKYSNFGPDCRH